MPQLSDDYKVIAELFPLWRKLQVMTALEFFCGVGKFLKLLELGGFASSGTEPETSQAIEAQIDGSAVYPYTLSDLRKFDDDQFDAVGMLRVDRAPDKSLDAVVNEGLRIGAKLFFYSSMSDVLEQKIFDMLDMSKVNILARRYNDVVGVSVLRL